MRYMHMVALLGPAKGRDGVTTFITEFFREAFVDPFFFLLYIFLQYCNLHILCIRP